MSYNLTKQGKQVMLKFILTAALLASGCSQPPPPPEANMPDTDHRPINANAIDSSSPSPPVTTSDGHPIPKKPASPTPSLSPLPPDAKAVRDAIAVVHDYYDAINSRNYRAAYELWEGKGRASDQSFEEFSGGFANTESVKIDTGGEPGDFEGAAGSQYVQIPALIEARTKDGRVQKYWGQYVLRRSMVDGATADQRAWRIYSAEIRRQ